MCICVCAHLQQQLQEFYKKQQEQLHIQLLTQPQHGVSKHGKEVGSPRRCDQPHDTAISKPPTIYHFTISQKGLITCLDQLLAQGLRPSADVGVWKQSTNRPGRQTLAPLDAPFNLYPLQLWSRITLKVEDGVEESDRGRWRRLPALLPVLLRRPPRPSTPPISLARCAAPRGGEVSAQRALMTAGSGLLPPPLWTKEMITGRSKPVHTLGNSSLHFIIYFPPWRPAVWVAEAALVSGERIPR